MKLILLQEVKKLGNTGDIVSVSPGYGRNYLIPRNFAVLANPKNVKNVGIIKQAALEKVAKAQTILKATALDLSGTELQFIRKADENGHLYGSVSETDIVSALKETGFEVHKDMVEGNKHIKNIGSYEVTINFGQNISSNIKVNVQSEE